MDKKSIYEQIAKKLNKNIEEINDSLKFKEDLNLDSIDMVEIVMDIEDEHNITISDEDATRIKTIGDLVKILES